MDWRYSELYHRLCSTCHTQFPEGLLSLRLRQAAFANGEVDPDSATGILQCGDASTGVTTAAAAHVVTTNMVADLPVAKVAAKATAKATAKTQLKKDTSHIKARQVIVENIGLYESYRDEYLRGKEVVPQACLDGIAQGRKALAEHDKQHVVDTSAKTIAELAGSFAEIDTKVKNVEERILQGVINLQHEVTTRELQLEKLV